MEKQSILSLYIYGDVQTLDSFCGSRIYLQLVYGEHLQSPSVFFLLLFIQIQVVNTYATIITRGFHTNPIYIYTEILCMTHATTPDNKRDTIQSHTRLHNKHNKHNTTQSLTMDSQYQQKHSNYSKLVSPPNFLSPTFLPSRSFLPLYLSWSLSHQARSLYPHLPLLYVF